MTNTLIAGYANPFEGVATACDDHAGVGDLSKFTMDVVQGSHDYVMVFDTGAVADEGTYWTTVKPPFVATLCASGRFNDHLDGRAVRYGGGIASVVASSIQPA